MRVLIAHNFYQQPGGEDQVFASEAALLEEHGHAVERFTIHNDDIAQMGRIGLAARTIWNRAMRKRLADAVRAHRAEVVHFHNTFPLLSPAAYAAAHDAGAAVVQTLHNFRLLCPNAVFFRDGQVCQSCLGKTIAWPGLVHKCYRGSLSATAMTVAMVSVHRALKTWRRRVDAYIVLSPSAKAQFVRGGLPADKLFIKPNFVNPDPGVGDGQGGYAVYVGRLSMEKGVATLLEAWKHLRQPVPLRIIGDGPLSAEVQQAVAAMPHIQWLGRRTSAEVYDLIKHAAFLVLPSGCFENFPRALAEAFACGTPAIASGHGAMADIVTPGKTGRLFTPGDAADLARQVDHLASAPHELFPMRLAAREEYEAKYAGDANCRQLIDIYERACASASGVSAALAVGGVS